MSRPGFVRVAPTPPPRPGRRTAPHHDVVVVGARVAGAATALLLARQGLRVLLVDRAAAPGTDTLSTHALMRGGVLQLHRWGLLEALVTAGTPPVRQTIVHYGDEADLVEIKERNGVDALYAPRRTVLDPLLVEAAAAAGAEVRYGVAVDGVIGDGDVVCGVTATDAKGRRLRLRAPLVVGADGLRSRIAAAVGSEVTWQGGAASAMIYGYFTGLPAEGYEWFYRPSASAGIIPTNDGRVCVWVGAPAASGFGGNLDAVFQRWLAAAAPEAVAKVAAARPAGRLRGYPGVPSFLRRCQGPGWALIGDSAAFRDPLSAHGMTDALRDAELLARAVVAGMGETAGLPGALAEYEAQRDAVALPLARISDRVAGYDWTLPELRTTLLGLSKAMGREVQLIESFDGASAAAA
jgi:2-polyprenyl-6-methoxyphenol hydroxylase-like FAD-dependent oxidoreductase